ncbi:Sulphatase-modifying factor protein [Candidatus Sulfotelmatobacter kueseliae]|uniref:Sulphatase-modifying factor protein n=1 Tax=Candidatus Sulfotelmatobacter kueseliae TaxID=2042962 RepID=A0A2U3K3K9_9BACT|nr:Sulphatase-modifying factor protein [Candidatus Sulfotelmatobacter kueseliae]
MHSNRAHAHQVFCNLLVGMLLALAAAAQTTRYSPEGDQLPGPDCLNPVRPSAGQPKICTREDYKIWLDDITHWRNEMRIRAGYSGREYERPELKWARSSFIQPQMMVEDRYFYDPESGQYTVDKYLDDLEKRYGGIDSILIWSVYPNVGIDDRNQYDMVGTMPGGVEGVRKMVVDFHRRGVRVFFPVMPWDQGTHDPGVPNWEATAKLLADVGADGINGDTFWGLPRAFQTAADDLGHPLVLEPEHTLLAPFEGLTWNTMTWGYWQYPAAPMVSALKWLEPRHMVNVCDRWKRDKTDNLQYAFFNGVGYESWENVFGIWSGIVPRDAEAIRRVAKIERAMADFLVSPEWQPYAATERYGIYASRWPLEKKTLWTIVNRLPTDTDGPQLRVPAQSGLRYFDLWHGVELTPQLAGGGAFLSFPIEAHGFGAILATPDAPDGKLQALLEAMKALASSPLTSYSNEWKFLPQQMAKLAKTATASTAPPGMVKIPSGDFVFKVNGIEIEGFNESGVDVQYPWEDSPRRHHLHTVHVDSFWIDKYPVTNAEFKKFLDATHYHPKDDSNFLRDWRNGTYPPGWENKPVTWVSLEDARAYAAWAGKRLPHEWEWQYAAQGGDERLYPWGNTWDDAAVPVPDKGRALRGPDGVDTHPRGTSSFGVADLVGNVWQWTDEFSDEHTRAAVVRGGSYYQPQGSVWYFPQAYRLDQHGKLLLMAPSKDRAGTLGFRCVKDVE